MHFRLTTYRRKKLAKEQIIRNMDDKIKQLSEAGKRVSLHVVSPSAYAKKNVIDVSTKTLQHQKEFIQELLNNNSVAKIIQPLYPVSFFQNRGNGKLIYDNQKNAIHIEINQ